MKEIQKLIETGDEAALVERLTADEPDLRAAAAHALGILNRSSSVTALVGAMGDEQIQVRKAAAEALAAIGERAIPALVATLEGRGGRLAPYALWALGEIGSPSAVDTLIDRAQNASTWRIRWSAVESLGDVGGKRAGRALVTALDDPDERVRSAAGDALMRIGTQAIAPLAETLRHPQREMRQAARDTLGRIASPEAEVILRREQLFFWIPVVMLVTGVFLVMIWLLSALLF